jgi:hypothetical protein
MSDKKRNDELFSLKELKSLLKKLDTEFWLKFFIPVVFLV